MPSSRVAGAAQPLARQTCDGLGRPLTTTIGGRLTRFEYTPGQLPPSAKILADGQRIDYTYEAALENKVLSILPAGEPAHHFTYHKKLALSESASGPLGSQQLHYTTSGKPLSDTWTVDDQAHITTWRHSLGGLLLGFVDAQGSDHQRHHDKTGRLEKVVIDNITAVFDYDDFSRPEVLTTTDSNTGNRLVQTLSYDSCGREHTRTFVMTVGQTTHISVQTLCYNDLDQLVSRHWQDDSRQGLETFDYDLRGRLTTYTAEPDVAPEDPFGNRIAKQAFTLNVLDGYEQVITTFADGTEDIAHYAYENQDPTQVSSISHSHPSRGTTLITLGYDDCGRLVSDSLGRTLTWDAQDRLTHVEFDNKVCAYGYDPSGNLCDRVVDGQLSRSFFSGGQATHEQTGTTTVQHIRDGASLFALNGITNAILLGQDAQGSIRIAADSDVHNRHYTAHGAEPENSSEVPFGYTGERREPLTGWYIPAGYRPYDPLLMMFLSPDSESPFGRGGLNPYAYCAGDPVNRIDPDGHDSLSWAASILGLTMGVIGSIASFGAFAPALFPAAAALMSSGIASAISVGVATVSVNLTASTLISLSVGTLSAVSLATGIGATTLEITQKDEKTMNILGWISLVSGLPSMLTDINSLQKPLNKLSDWSVRSAGRGWKRLANNGSVFGKSPAQQLGNTPYFTPFQFNAMPPSFAAPSARPVIPQLQAAPSSGHVNNVLGQRPRLPTAETPPQVPSTSAQQPSVLPVQGPESSSALQSPANPALSVTNTSGLGSRSIGYSRFRSLTPQQHARLDRDRLFFLELKK